MHSFTRILNFVLMTAPELKPLRDQIKTALHKSATSNASSPSSSPSSCAGASSAIRKDKHKAKEPALKRRESSPQVDSSMDDPSTAVFDVLYHCWCCSTLSAFSLCLLSREYFLASAIISRAGGRHLSAGFLTQGEKLLELLETPVFLQVRLDLLQCCNASLHSRQLLKALYGLLMLLPTSTSFSRMSARLRTVGTSGISSDSAGMRNGSKMSDLDNYTAISPERMSVFLSTYDQVQESMGFMAVV